MKPVTFARKISNGDVFSGYAESILEVRCGGLARMQPAAARDQSRNYSACHLLCFIFSVARAILKK
ncbi:MAG TPA: hypothetical protein VKM55_26705 [Candidatus Lokiarchaeia archaeon]|nr:hypothetical protein [Candidatus Lokiarchaeia archaeon]